MNLEQDNVIGIVGGMGPEAGAMLLNAISAHTRAASDQEHMSVVLMSFPGHITDRTTFLEGGTTVNPAFSVARVIGLLEAAGATVAGIACNTIYAPPIFNTIQEELDRHQVKIKLLHMPAETCHYIKQHYPRAQRIGIMSTNGTYKSGVYRHLLEGLGYDVILPDPDFQDGVIHRMVYDPQFGVKANPGNITRETIMLMKKSTDFFRRQKADAIILGCTELPLILVGKPDLSGIPVINSIEAMALALIREATAGIKIKSIAAPSFKQSAQHLK
ncbi:aspartate/glutamate racemase family protein [Chitinophaga nivalis]|uniref:Amino acid racemase n=1 Tax=Chitinophaga nivalis TaxID=2991709 RepID=A0ABT3IJT0_9BACT|nr:amino acid racemase [Chitinophaga nivalis]MCW3466079.1 amino acid racemase [Chitinophaga nivalis]MCW3484230.1 amino acid racemase [Chitinophaga nivalis]